MIFCAELGRQGFAVVPGFTFRPWMQANQGFTEGNVFGLGMVVTDLAIDFRSESFAGDKLIIDVGVDDYLSIIYDPYTVGAKDGIFAQIWIQAFGNPVVPMVEGGCF